MGRFKKGEPRPANAGRKKGSVNKLTKGLKEAIIGALEAEGGQEYLRRVAQHDLRTFCALLGRLLPMEVAGEPSRPVKIDHEIEFHIVDPKE